MKKFTPGIFLLIFLFSCARGIWAQEAMIYIPTEIKQAYEQGSRSMDGKPGPNYFQNRTDYRIEVEFDPVSRLISGRETITLTNNSPDSLGRVFIRIDANILKKGVTRANSIDPSDVTDGVAITRIMAGDHLYDLEKDPPYQEEKIMVLRLPRPIAPGTAETIAIDWHYTFQAKSNIREGRYHNTSYFIAYWFPRVAVYDDIYGWNRHNYNAEQEFYHEYGDYDVNITVPGNYYVWSSGLLQNAGEVLPEKQYRMYEASRTSDEILHILDCSARDEKKPVGDTETKTWRFHADFLPDFAFAVSDTYCWDATSVEVRGKRTHIHAVYFKDSRDFREVAEVSRQTVKLLADSVIGYDFPYPQMTVFNGHFGMEFPMMVNEGDFGSRNEMLFATSHEIAHTYFPFLVGTNEERYAWMDEGLITYLPKMIEDRLSRDKNLHAFQSNIRSYSRFAGTKYDLPLMVSSDQLLGINYMFASYSRSAIAFYVLESILGKSLFQDCLLAFIERWNGKHPTAYDLFFTFEDISGTNLSWFWNPWFFDFGYPDLALEEATQDGEDISITIQKAGNLPVPVELILSFDNGKTARIHRPASIWQQEGDIVSIQSASNLKLVKVEIDTDVVPDNNRSNNFVLLK